MKANRDGTTSGPRVYNLFPLLAGPIPRWREHLDRIAGMGFDWIYLNPVQYPGFSGSLYSVKDYDRIHPFLEEETQGDPQGALRRFLEEAGSRGIRVMLDLVMNHTGKDALLTEQHPEWYERDETGEIRSPFAIDPADATKKTVWGDLAELNFRDAAARDGIVTYFSDWSRRQLELGFAGFRCDAAYKVPAEAWSSLIASARTVRGDAAFFAETLGCRLEEVAAVASAGFDYLFNSSKWWDFRQPWALEQYEAHRRIAPSISFPETHDTDRLADEASGREEVARARYLFAAFFSTGVMMPIGYEFGFRKRLHVISSRPGDWEEPAYDLTAFTAAVHRMKSAHPTLNEEGPLRAIGGVRDLDPSLRAPVDGSGTFAEDSEESDDAVVRLRKDSEHGGAPILAWIHPGEGEAPAPWEEACAAIGIDRERLRVISPPCHGAVRVAAPGQGADRDAHAAAQGGWEDGRDAAAPLGPWEVRLLASTQSDKPR